MSAILSDTSFWALVGLILFFVVIAYFKVPGSIANQLDGRAQRIGDELEQARRMREEAQEILASYQRRQREAEEEAEQIVQQAKDEAKRVREAANKDLDERLERRTQQAEAKIAQAQQQAEQEIRAAAAEKAIQAAEAMLRDGLTKGARESLFKDSVKDLEKRLS